jgi:hypothetical protein
MPAILTGFIRFKTLIFRKQAFKSVFLHDVDTTSKKPENRIRKMAIGARMRLRIVYLLVRGN